ncbi:hypothetical protein [[Flexibacter] sp. ATCC 35103]|uniref:hypothetical protein n=1 Tax=[Flexibacter] sp. ATCC 35103 TaxID=1937528 RepID=UPI0009D11CFF|nr:hypothetical protein [[Flexibacter] sp. ATCC 35103]OMQ12522.1 hypothetical protein BXU01_06495 [[Flexibacter] sp. ATCC 35103]
MVKINKYSVLIFLVIIYSCVPITHNKNKFDIKKSESIDEIKTYGYYYSNNRNNESIVARLLFRDGFYKELGVVNSEINNKYFKKYCDNIESNCFKNLECMIDNYDNFFKIETNFLNRSSEIWDWGRFEIKEGKIKIQYFYNRFGNYYLVEERGVIIDNKSFNISSKYDYRNGISENLNITYFFKEYDVNKALNCKPRFFNNY